MPELPEVETVATGLRYLAGRRLGSLELHDDRVWFESEAAPALLHGRQLVEVSRRGKYLLLRFEGRVTLIQHLRMTGKMLEAGSKLVPAAVAASYGRRTGKGLQVRCSFRFEGAEIWFFDTRRFGTLTLTLDEERFFAAKGVAPDPLQEPERAYAWMQERLAKTSKPLKSALLDQSVVAGVGNIYADEALFSALINPLTPASRLKDPRPLWDQILRILRESIRQGGSTIRDYVSAEGREGTFAQSHNVYDRAGEPCRACGTGIRRIVLGGRSTHFCPSCQPVPKGTRLTARAKETKGGSSSSKGKLPKGESARAKAARKSGKHPRRRPR